MVQFMNKSNMCRINFLPINLAKQLCQIMRVPPLTFKENNNFLSYFTDTSFYLMWLSLFAREEETTMRWRTYLTSTASRSRTTQPLTERPKRSVDESEGGAIASLCAYENTADLFVHLCNSGQTLGHSNSFWLSTYRKTLNSIGWSPVTQNTWTSRKQPLVVAIFFEEAKHAIFIHSLPRHMREKDTNFQLNHLETWNRTNLTLIQELVSESHSNQRPIR